MNRSEQKEISNFNKKFEKHTFDTIKWIGDMSHKFISIQTSISLGNPLTEDREFMKKVFKLKNFWESIS